jgi:hypothetical protein
MTYLIRKKNNENFKLSKSTNSKCFIDLSLFILLICGNYNADSRNNIYIYNIICLQLRYGLDLSSIYKIQFRLFFHTMQSSMFCFCFFYYNNSLDINCLILHLFLLSHSNRMFRNMFFK